ncbi:MAG TPA: hypothetical protein VLI69_05560 [Gammaproteobacteria bacterium]|nr:hypothetical protein [Gammaproteobacteria bacterium]
MKQYLASSLLALSVTSVTYLSSAQAASDYQFSLAQIPDTQSYFFHPGWADPGQIVDMYQWIIEDQKSGKNTYKYIFHVGDIIEKDGLYAGGALDPESEWEWNQANAIFNTIDSNMNAAKVTIPYGFVTGNHDTQNAKPGGDPFGNGDFLPSTTQQAIAFFKSRYDSTPNNPHQSIDIPDIYPGINPQKFPDKSYLISYYTFQVGDIHFIALNLPYVLSFSHQAPLAADAVNKFIDSHQNDSLVIINSHDCGQGQAFAGHQNVFMVICGHAPSGISNTGTNAPIPALIVKPSPDRPVYVYRFDYQAIYTGKPPSMSDNLPQHPIIRTYDFTLNTSNKTLSWNATDIQPWVAENRTFRTTFPSGPAIFAYTKGLYGWAPAAVFDSSRKSIGTGTINYSSYLGPSSSCAIPFKSNLSGCNAKAGSTVTICWDSPPGSNPQSYVIQDYNHKVLQTTAAKNFVDQGVGSSAHYDYYVHANCDDGSKSPDLLIDVPGDAVQK